MEDDVGRPGPAESVAAQEGLHVLVEARARLARARLGDFSSTRYEAVELGTWFWYYVTSVWIVLFAALYLL
jgi:heme/copper-type cytochrome/quinol oxidase subunit 3